MASRTHFSLEYCTSRYVFSPHYFSHEPRESMTTIFIEQLTVADFSFLDTSRGLVGETLIVDVELEGQLDDQGMVMDFGHLKRRIKSVVDRCIDHCLVVPARAPGLRENKVEGGVSLQFPLSNHAYIRVMAPPSAITSMPAAEIDVNTIATYLDEQLRPVLSDNTTGLRISLRPEEINGACYHYSHGLKRHAGKCQRIAHGHRSRICITREGLPATDLEMKWARRWNDMYIANREDLVEAFDEGGTRYLRFAYEANEGKFTLVLPASHCYLIDGDTTVENLARHIHDETQRGAPGHKIVVRAYEGLNKGAIVYNP